MKFFSDKRGSVTPMMAICIAAVVFLNFVIYDALRINSLSNISKRMQTIAVSSALSRFDRGLETGYGIYCLREDEKVVLENRIREILSEDGLLNEFVDIIKSNGGIDFNIMDYDVSDIELSLKDSIGDKYVLRDEICALMKYKSVANGAEKLVEKLTEVLDCAKETDSFTYAEDMISFVEAAEIKIECLDLIINGSPETMHYCLNGYPESTYHKLLLDFPELDILEGKNANETYTGENIDELTLALGFFNIGFGVYSDFCENVLKTLEDMLALKSEADELYQTVCKKIENDEITQNDELKNAIKSYKSVICGYDFEKIGGIVVKNYEELNEAINCYESFEETLKIGSEIDEDKIQEVIDRFNQTDENYELIEFNADIKTKTIDEESGFEPKEADLEAEAKLFFDMCNRSVPEEIFSELPSKTEKSKNKSLSGFLDEICQVSDIVGEMIEAAKTDYEINDYIATYFYDASESKNINEHYLMGEVEYIMFGNREDSKNLTAVYTELAAMRAVLNVSHILTNSEKRSIVNTAAKAMAAATEGYGEPVYKAVIILAWASLETANDLKLLQDGKKVPLVKTAKDWAMSIDGELLFEEEEKNENITDMTYSDYVNMLLCLVPQSIKLARIQDLIELNLYKKTHVYTKVSELFTSCEAKAKYSFKTFAIINKDGKHCYSWEEKKCANY